VQATIHLAPPRRPARPGAVPDVRGLFYPVRLKVAARYGLVVRVLRLTERPMAVDGPVAGRTVRNAANWRLCALCHIEAAARRRAAAP
jgi:hypothetical protein